MLQLSMLRRQGALLRWPALTSAAAHALPRCCSAIGLAAAAAAPRRRRRLRQAHAAGIQCSTAEHLQRLVQPPASLPTTAVGQVMSANANYVRVEVHRLGADARSNGAQGAAWELPPGTPQTQLLCTMRALLKKMQQSVLVGDHVHVGSINWAEARAQVEAVLPRSTLLLDPAVANVDHVLLLFGLTQPPYDEQQVTRFLVSVEAVGLPVTLVLNKADLVPEREVAARVAQAAAWGYAALPLSCETGTGLAAVAAKLVGRTSVVAGPSGAGKSSLINALRLGRHRPDADLAVGPAPPTPGAGPAWASAPFPPPGALGGGGDADPDARTGEGEDDDWGFWEGGEAAEAEAEEAEEWDGGGAWAAGDAERRASGGVAGPSGGPGFLPVGELTRMGRGKHTTTSVSLIPLPGGGLLADTPGFSRPTLDGVRARDLGAYFPEVRAAVEAAGGCRFADCVHLREPGCAVSGAGLDRYPWYVKLVTEVQEREEYDVRGMQLAKRQREGTVKAVTGRGGRMRYEARLDAKRHRTASRRTGKQQLLEAARVEEGDTAEPPHAEQ